MGTKNQMLQIDNFTKTDIVVYLGRADCPEPEETYHILMKTGKEIEIKPEWTRISINAI